MYLPIPIYKCNLYVLKYYKNKMLHIQYTKQRFETTSVKKIIQFNIFFER